MRKLHVYIASSLDGQIARPDGSVDWLPETGEEDYGYQAFYDSVDTLLMGYSTYQTCLGFGEWPYPDKKVYVFTRAPASAPVHQEELVTDDPVAFVRQLKKQPGRAIWLVGGGKALAPLQEAGLVDEYHLALVPVLLGEGIPLFTRLTTQQPLQLTGHQVFPDGLVMLSYSTTAGS
jgi:dihydrofolate reductase